jgi:Spy/CpxP family protein refolding chaperone
MSFQRITFPAVCIAAMLGGIVTTSAAAEPGTPSIAPTRHGGHHYGPAGSERGFHRTLEQLDLTPEQKLEIQALVEQARPGMHATKQSGHANRQQLLTVPPTDPAYPGLLEFAKSNAAEQIQHMSDLWSQVYAVLTEDQRARIPEVVATAATERDARRADRRMQHTKP